MQSYISKRMTAKRFFRILLISAILGAAISVVMTGGDLGPSTAKSLATGALIGFCISACAISLEAAARGPISQLGERAGRVARAFVFLVAGAAGYFIGSLLAQVLIWGTPPAFSRALRVDSLLIAGSVAMAIGVAFYTYELLRSRLEQSVQQLKEREFADKELELARSIQRRLLPPTSIEALGYRVESRNVAARYVAGDFYDVFHMADGTLGLVVADVAGKGIGASLIMATVKAVLPLIAAGKSVEETLEELNVRLHRDLARREFVALAYAHFDPATSEFRIGNAGLPDPWLIRKTGEARPLHVDGPRLPLGVRPNLRYSAATMKLSPGDRVLLYSDGLPEAPMENGEPLGYEAFGDLVRNPEPDAAVWLDRLLDEVRSRTSDSVEDDWTAMLFEAVPKSSDIPSLESVAPGIGRIIPSVSRTT